MATQVVRYEELLKDDREGLRLFLESLAKFDRAFCDHVFAGDDFSIRLEVHGCKGKLIHIRTSVDGFKRPNAIEGREPRLKRVG